MYCFSCGAAVAQSLTYCNHCGAKLTGTKDTGLKPPELFPASLIWAIVTVFVVGLGATIALLVVMKEVANFQPGLILAITLLSFFAMFAVEAVLVSLLMSRKRGTKEIDETERVKERATKELGVAQERALPEPALSVTEHTTRTLEPVYRERQAE